MTSHWLCHQCLTFHSKPKIHPSFKYGLTPLTWKCVQPSCYLSHTMSTPYTFPPIPNLYFMVRMPINRHLLGSEHGEPLDIFSEPSLSHKNYCPIPKSWGRISTEACIVANKIYVRRQHRVGNPFFKDFCPHIKSSYPENLMAPIIKCLLSHRNTVSCENCRGLRQCCSCTSEFETQISPLGPTGHALEITYWKYFGTGRSPDDLKWRQHERRWIPDLQDAEFSPGSVRAVFESEKSKSMQNSICNIEKSKPLSRFKRKLGRVCAVFI